MKSSLEWETSLSDTINTINYFIYRYDDEAIYELVYPSYFNYYSGIWSEDNKDFIDNGWTSHSQNMDSILFYLPFRDGEVVENEFSSI